MKDISKQETRTGMEKNTCWHPYIEKLTPNDLLQEAIRRHAVLFGQRSVDQLPP
jgi:hypothetical protein